MPIKLVAVSEKKFNKWVKSKGGKVAVEEKKKDESADESTEKESKKSEEGAI
jgi:heme/copper-type cytochrome/quinol oxidase subunit 2